MANPLVINIQDGNLGGGASSTLTHWIVGNCSAGAAETVYTIGSPNDVKSTLGYGPLSRETEDVLTKLGGVAKVVKCNTGTAASSSFALGTTGVFTGLISISGTPLDIYNIQFKITKGGVINLNQVYAQYSFDGGKSWSNEELILSGTSTIAPTGTGMTFTLNTSGTFPTGIAITATCIPASPTGANLTAALSTLSGTISAGAPTGLLVAVESNTAGAGPALFDSVNTFISSMKTSFNTCPTIAVVPACGGDIPGQSAAQLTTALAATFNEWVVKANSDKNPVAVAGLRGNRTLTGPLNYFGSPLTSLAGQLYTDVLKNDPYVDPGAVVDSGVISGLSTITYDEGLRGSRLSDIQICVPKTHVGIPGFYWEHGWLKYASGSDFRHIYSTRVFYEAYKVIARKMKEFINSSPPLKTDGTGQLTKKAALFINDKVNKEINAFIMSEPGPMGTTGWASACSFSVDQTYDVLTNEKIIGTFRMVPHGIARTVEVTMSFAREITV